MQSYVSSQREEDEDFMLHAQSAGVRLAPTDDIGQAESWRDERDR